MALKKIQFTWATPRLSDGRWRLGLFNFQQHPDPSRPLPLAGVPSYWKGYLHHTLHFSVRGLLRWGALLAVLAYFAGAGVVLARYEARNPHNRVGYLDLILPSRWGRRDSLLGEGFIILAREKLAAGRFREGFGLMRLGVNKNPTDFEARLELARLYLGNRLRPQAEKLLRDGLAFGYPGRAYLEVAFSLAADADNPPAWVELCQLVRARLDTLPPASVPPGDSLWLDRQTVKALLADKRGAEALALVSTRYPEADPFRREITVLQLIERQEAPAAVVLASTWADEQPQAPEPLRLLARAQRETGDFAGMDATLTRLRELNPAKPEALLYALVQNHLAGRSAQARAAIDELLFRHGANAALYPALTAVLVEIRLSEALPPLTRELAERGLSPRPALWAQLQADVAARDWSAVLATAATIEASSGPAFTEVQSTWLEAMIRLARACADAGSGNQSALVETIADHPGTLRLYRLVLDCLLEAGRVDTAAHVLALAEGPFPASRGLAAARAAIESRSSALATAPSTDEPAMSRPAGLDPLSGLDAFTAAFSRRIQEKDTAGALALLAAARRAQPAWLVGEEPRLDALELPVRARDEDPLRLQLLVRNELGRDDDAPAALLALARSIREDGHPSNALFLVKEVLRHDPSNPDALSLIETWEPRKNPDSGATRP